MFPSRISSPIVSFLLLITSLLRTYWTLLLIIRFFLIAMIFISNKTIILKNNLWFKQSTNPIPFYSTVHYVILYWKSLQFQLYMYIVVPTFRALDDQRNSFKYYIISK